MKKLTLYLLLLTSFSTSYAQNEEQTKKLAEATDFSIPSSPAFILLDATTAKVNKPAFVKDFKFDWVFKDNRLAPNIALEIQPVWMLFYKSTSLSQYQKQEWLPRQLSTLSFSVGTTKKDSLQALAWAIRLNVFREKNADPMLNKEYIKKLQDIIGFTKDEKRIALQKAALEDALEEETDPAKKTELLQQIEDLNALLDKEDARKKELYNTVRKEFQDRYWNANMIDIGFGKAYNYFGEELEDLKFQSKRTGVWVNGSYNFKTTNFVMSGLYKFLGGDTTTHFAGVNLRYGKSKANFFAEYVYEKTGEISKNTIAYGGDFRINNTLMIQFGLRTEYDKSFSLKALKPLVNLNWILKTD